MESQWKIYHEALATAKLVPMLINNMTEEQALSPTQLFEGDVNGSPFPVACFGGRATPNIHLTRPNTPISRHTIHISNNNQKTKSP